MRVALEVARSDFKAAARPSLSLVEGDGTNHTSSVNEGEYLVKLLSTRTREAKGHLNPLARRLNTTIILLYLWN